MKSNYIVKYNLESRAIQLRGAGKPYDEISLILSDESKQKITKSTVFRYFETNTRAKEIISEKLDAAATQFIEAEVETINRRLKSIDHLWDKINESEDLHEISYATKVYNEAIDGLAKELGKFPNTGINIDNSKTENTLNVVLHLPRKDPYPGKI